MNKTHTWASKTGIKSFSLERAGPSNQRLGSKGRVQNTCKRWVCVSLRVWLYGEKLSMVEGSPTYLSYPGWLNLSYSALQHKQNSLHEKQKCWHSWKGCPPRCVTLLWWYWVTLLARPTFLHINPLAHLAGSKDVRAPLAQAIIAQANSAFSHINSL